MCGIVGYTGHLQAAPILLDGLSKLEYRGYDSAGLAVRNGEKKTEIVKAKGRLKSLAEKTDNGNALIGTCGYSILSGDGHCENIPSWFQAFLLKVVNVSTMPDPITEDDIDAIAKLETEGRRLLKQLAAANN